MGLNAVYGENRVCGTPHTLFFTHNPFELATALPVLCLLYTSASAYGGVGTVPGVIVGAVLMGVINLGMSVMGIDQNFQKVVKGGVLLAAVVFDVLSKREDS